MKIKNVKVLYYSPTGTTEKICQEIAKGSGFKDAETVNITGQTMRSCNFAELDKSLVIIGIPVYAGRIPKETESYLKKLRGKDTPVVLVAVYGNRHYDDALLEMNDIISERGFIPIAAAAFIGEHSFSTDKMPIAAGRPDRVDLSKARFFGKNISNMLSRMSNLDKIKKIGIPGKFPYRESTTFPVGSPETDMSKCIKCGICARKCPVKAISVKESVQTDGELCTFCCACVKSCPTGARQLTLAPMVASTKKLFDNCKERKEPEIFMAL